MSWDTDIPAGGDQGPCHGTLTCLLEVVKKHAMEHWHTCWRWSRYMLWNTDIPAGGGQEQYYGTPTYLLEVVKKNTMEH